MFCSENALSQISNCVILNFILPLFNFHYPQKAAAL